MYELPMYSASRDLFIQMSTYVRGEQKQQDGAIGVQGGNGHFASYKWKKNQNKFWVKKKYRGWKTQHWCNDPFIAEETAKAKLLPLGQSCVIHLQNEQYQDLWMKSCRIMTGVWKTKFQAPGQIHIHKYWRATYKQGHIILIAMWEQGSFILPESHSFH